MDATDVPGLIAKVEPDSEQYRKTEVALGHYLDLAKQQAESPELLRAAADGDQVGGAG